jgi:hypothetical protein
MSASFFILSPSLFRSHSTIQHYITYAVEKVSLNTELVFQELVLGRREAVISFNIPKPLPKITVEIMNIWNFL